MSTDCRRPGTSESEERAGAFRDALNGWLRPDAARDFRGANIGDSLHATAKRLAGLARGCRRMYLTIPTFEYPDTAAVFAILGTENSRRDAVLVDEVTGDSMPMSTHYFSWLAFTAIRGKVTSLAVDIKASGY